MGTSNLNDWNANASGPATAIRPKYQRTRTHSQIAWFFIPHHSGPVCQVFCSYCFPIYKIRSESRRSLRSTLAMYRGPKAWSIDIYTRQPNRLPVTAPGLPLFFPFHATCSGMNNVSLFLRPDSIPFNICMFLTHEDIHSNSIIKMATAYQKIAMDRYDSLGYTLQFHRNDIVQSTSCRTFNACRSLSLAHPLQCSDFANLQKLCWGASKASELKLKLRKVYFTFGIP